LAEGATTMFRPIAILKTSLRSTRVLVSVDNDAKNQRRPLCAQGTDKIRANVTARI
jgi:hypothetical protein